MLNLIWQPFAGDAYAAMSAAEAMRDLSRAHGLALQSIYAEMTLGWAHGRLYDAAVGAAELRQWLGEYRKLGVNIHSPFYHGLLAELELEALGAESAATLIGEGLAIGQQTGIRCDLAFLHHLRGDILRRRDPSNPAPADDAYRTAIGIAKEQGARSYELGQRCRSPTFTNRPTAPPTLALPSPALKALRDAEMREVADAQALLAAIEAGAHVRPE